MKIYYIIKLFHAAQCFLIIFNLSYGLMNWYLVFVPYYLVGVFYVLIFGVVLTFWIGFIKKMFEAFCFNFILFLIFGYFLLILVCAGLAVGLLFYLLIHKHVSFDEEVILSN